MTFSEFEQRCAAWNKSIGIKRLRVAWKLKVWPWLVPREVITWLSLEPLTPNDIKRTRELADRLGWKRKADYLRPPDTTP